MSKKYTVNEMFFSDWSPEMAYILGFIYADGNMSRKSYKIRIDSKDSQILEDIRNKLGSNHPIKKQSNKYGEWYELMISNKKIYSSLRKLGIYPNKSLSMRLPNIPTEYQSHFVRGYFDGDGCIYEVKRKRPTPGMEIDFATGSKQFAESLVEVLNNSLESNLRLTNPRKNYYRIRGWNKASEDMFQYMYSGNPEIFLERKFEKFLEIMDKRNYVPNLT